MKLALIANKLNNALYAFSSLFLRDNGRGASQGYEIQDDPGFFKTVIDAISQYLLNVLQQLYSAICMLIYMICKLCLNVIDFIAVFIEQFMGLTTAEKISQNSSFEEADIFFKLIFSDTAKKIFWAVVGVSIVLLILFTIVALIKNEWQNVVEDKVVSFGKVIKKTLMAVFMMIMVPVMVIFGVLFSNVILVSFLNVIKSNTGGGNISIGGEVFVASTYNANQYRIYADNNNKIPVYFNFETAESTSTSSTGSLSSDVTEGEMNELADEDYKTKVSAAKDMLFYESYYKMTDISAINSYYKNYDNQYFKTKQIEYYAMADFIDFAIKSGYDFKIMNVADVYDSIKIANNREILNKTVQNYSTMMSSVIHAYDNDGNILLDEYDNDVLVKMITSDLPEVNSFKFNVEYNPDTVSGEPDLDSSGLCAYDSINGTNDEADGSKYIVVYSVPYIYTDDAVQNHSTVYFPLTDGSTINGYNFNSVYLQKGSPVLARGLFNDKNMPTAIRENGSNIEFYREDIIIPTIFDFLPHIEYKEVEDNDSQSIIELITGVDPSNVVPDISFDLNFRTAYTKQTVASAVLENGNLSLNYNFTQSGYLLNNVYSANKINIIILVFATMTILSSFITIVFNLIGRIFDMFVLFLTYPAFAATIPMNKNESMGGSYFGKWVNNFVQRTLGAYSYFITFSIVLFLLPFVMNMEFFTITAEKSGNIAMDALLTSAGGISFMNFITRVLFLLVLLTFIKKGPDFISAMLFKNYGKTYDMANAGIGKSVKGVISQGADMVSLKKPIGAVLNAKETALKLIPGSGLVKEYANNSRFRKGINNLDKNRSNLKKSGDQATAEQNIDSTNDTMKKNKDILSAKSRK